MVAEGEVLQHVHHVHGAVAVLLAQVLQDADLLLGLPVEALLVAHHLQGQVLLQLVVVDLGHLAEAALADHLVEGRRRDKREEKRGLKISVNQKARKGIRFTDTSLYTTARRGREADNSQW